MRTTQGYFVEPTGDLFQSVFPSEKSEWSQLHFTVESAIQYFEEMGIDRSIVQVIEDKS